MIISRARATASARLIGCKAEQQEKATNIREYMQEGAFSALRQGGNRIILGIELLQKVGAQVGETVQVSNGRGTPRPFKIVGTFKVGVKTLDEGAAYALIEDVQRLAGTPALVNEIAVRFKDYGVAPKAGADWAKTSRERVQSWDMINANVLNVFKIQTATRILVVAVILLVAGFGIYNILNVTVSQKRRDIAILRSMGFEPGDIRNLFLLQGFVLGVVGGTVGLGMGFMVSKYLTTISFGGGPLGGAGYLKISFDPEIYIRALVQSVAAASLASFLPARSAGKLTPIEIIRAGTE